MNELLKATIQAEEALLGAILIESTSTGMQSIREVTRLITPEDFAGFLPSQPIFRQLKRQRIYYAMTQSDLPPHQINTARTMANLKILQEDDIPYLCRLVATTPCSLDYMHYAKAVKGYSYQRQGKSIPVVPQRKGFAL